MAKFLFQRHDQFHGVERVSPKVLNEFGLRSYLVRIHAQLLDGDVFDSLFDSFLSHVFTPVLIFDVCLCDVAGCVKP